MATPSANFDVPYRDEVIDASRLLSFSWTSFFRSLYERIRPLGAEKSFALANNQSVAADIEDMKVNSRAVSHAVVEYLVQRVTTDTGATELCESGSFWLTYKPTSDTWALSVISENLPSNAGIVFSVTAAGQVQYTTTDITGTASLSRINWRMRTLAAKSSLYSSQGARV